MSFPFECLCSPQASILGFLGLGKQFIGAVVVFGRSRLTEDFAGLIDAGAESVPLWSYVHSAMRAAS